MSELFRTILIMSISGSVMAVLLFVFKPLVRHRLPKLAQYYLWLVVIFALLVPTSTFVKWPAKTGDSPTISTPSNVVDRYVITTEEEMTNLNQNIPMQSEVDDTQYMQVVKQSTSPISAAVSLFMPLYPLGVFVMLIYFAITYSVFIRLHMRRNRAATADEIALLAELCGEHRAPHLYRNPLAVTPMLIGLLRPAILLPDRVYTGEQLRSVLLHELTHMRRKDVLVKWLTLLVNAVHWFNPVVWLVRREINRACELACDETVIRGLDSAAKQNYGDTLIYVAADRKTPRAILSTTMCEEKKALKERLGAIIKSKKHTRIAIVASAILILSASTAAIVLGVGRAEPNSLIEMKIVHEENPAYALREMTLVWDDVVYRVVPMAIFERGAEIGYANDEYSTWRIYKLAGYNSDYVLAIESEDVWRVLSSRPQEQPFRQYILENATEKQRMERLLSITLNNDGTASLATALISSYMLVDPLYYTFTNSELLIHNESDNIIARFEVVDDSTVVFKEASVPLFADENARYSVLAAEPETAKTQASITLDDVFALAAKGDNLVMEDLKGYPGRDVGSGLYILDFKVVGGYTLMVGSGSNTGKPMYARLSIPGIEDTIDIRYEDINGYLKKYPVPDETSRQINQYLDTIKSSPSLSSATEDYINAHQSEYDAIIRMGTLSLPTLLSILNAGDMGLRGNIAALLVQEVVETQSQTQPQSEWLTGVLQSAQSDRQRWSKGLPPETSPATWGEEPVAPTPTTLYNAVTIALISDRTEYDAKIDFETSDLQIIAFIENELEHGINHTDETPDFKNDSYAHYQIKLFNDTGGYSAVLYYDAANKRAYVVKDGGAHTVGTDFAVYIESLLTQT